MYNNPYNNYNLPRYPQFNQYPQQSIQGINGRIVTGIEEAKASQISFDGTPSYFPCPAENKIYVKSIGLDGMPIFNVYQIMQQQAPQYANAQYVQELTARVDRLEKMLKGESNVQSNATNADVANATQPARNDNANVREQSYI